MVRNQDKAPKAVKTSYQAPEFAVIGFTDAGVLTTLSDPVVEEKPSENEGEWDPVADFLLG